MSRQSSSVPAQACVSASFLFMDFSFCSISLLPGCQQFHTWEGRLCGVPLAAPLLGEEVSGEMSGGMYWGGRGAGEGTQGRTSRDKDRETCTGEGGVQGRRPKGGLEDMDRVTCTGEGGVQHNALWAPH